jgi:hypothetical protein
MTKWLTDCLIESVTNTGTTGHFYILYIQQAYLVPERENHIQMFRLHKICAEPQFSLRTVRFKIIQHVS